MGDPDSEAQMYISPAGAIHGHIHAFGEDFVLEFAHRHYPDHGTPMLNANITPYVDVVTHLLTSQGAAVNAYTVVYRLQVSFPLL